MAYGSVFIWGSAEGAGGTEGDGLTEGGPKGVWWGGGVTGGMGEVYCGRAKAGYAVVSLQLSVCYCLISCCTWQIQTALNTLVYIAQPTNTWGKSMYSSLQS